jgi:TatA/E family protein of Tat protein translocase
MGPLGWQEMIAVFVIALLLFGPKKLPQLGKDLAKVMAEFRRATNDLKGTWDREMAAVDREGGLSETARQIDRELSAASVHESYHGTSSGYDSGHDYGYGVDQSAALSASVTEETTLGQEITPSIEGATATQGADTTVAELAPPSELPDADASSAPSYVADTVPRAKPSFHLADEDGNVHSS